jgi:hypothetical protein
MSIALYFFWSLEYKYAIQCDRIFSETTKREIEREEGN